MWLYINRHCYLDAGCLHLQIGPTKTTPPLISTIEIRVLWMVTKPHKSAARTLDRDCINRRGLDLSKEVLWVSVYLRQQIYQLSKLEVKKKFLPSGSVLTRFARAGLIGRIFFWPPTLTACKTAALWSTETHSTSLERSKLPLLTQILSKSLVALLTHFISIQSDLISIGLM